MKAAAKGRFQVKPGSRITGVMRMKSRESLVRLKEFQVNEKRRQLQQLQMMMSEFERMMKDLESQIVVEEKKSGISDPNHFAYPTFAKAARQRADNLQVSIKELKMQEEALEQSLEEMQAEYARAAALEERDGAVRARA
jgi:chaperonin cofactor prefoldin